jgi:ring-1,2-phenylacetyl-CoA epoxidase subunit PaaD
VTDGPAGDVMAGGLVAGTEEAVRAVAASVTDPELPPLTLADLGVLRSVSVDPESGAVLVTITPTYSGCPAIEAMRADLVARLSSAGYRNVRVRVALSPAWTTDWITEEGRRKLADAGIAPPGRIGPRAAGPVPLLLEPVCRPVPCPRCGSGSVELSRFGSTPCKSLRRCTSCSEPFEHVKEL